MSETSSSRNTELSEHEGGQESRPEARTRSWEKLPTCFVLCMKIVFRLQSASEFKLRYENNKYPLSFLQDW